MTNPENVVSQVHNLIQEVVNFLQAAPHQRHDCQEVAKNLDLTVKPLVEEILYGGAPLTDPFRRFLRELETKVIRLKKLGQSLRDQSWVVKHVFTSSTLGQFRESISEVRDFLRTLPSVQSQIVQEHRREVQEQRRETLALKFENITLRNTVTLFQRDRQGDQGFAIGEGNIVSRSRELLSKPQRVPILFSEWKPLADLLMGLDSPADAAALVELGAIPFLVRRLEGESATVAAKTLERLIRLDSKSSPLLATTGGIHALCKMLQSSQMMPSTSFDNIAVLELLAQASEERSNKTEIILGDGVRLLVTISNRGAVAVHVQEMTLTILLNLSREINAKDLPGREDFFVSALTTEEVCKYLLDTITIRGQDSSTEKAVVAAISIVRNISLSGISARAKLMQEGRGAIRVIMDRMYHHGAVASADVVRVSVVALERFTTMPEGRQVFLDYGGVEKITEVLRIPVGNAQAKSYAAKILVTLTDAENPQICGDACGRILVEGTISHLKGMLECEHQVEHRTEFINEGQEQACLLLQNLLHNARTRSDVCTAIRVSECYPKLLELKKHGCHSTANAVLEELELNHNSLSPRHRRKQVIRKPDSSRS